MYILLSIAAVLALVMIPVAIKLRSVVHDEAFGEAFPGNKAIRDATDALAGVSGFLLLISLATFVLFIIWMWRAAKNVGRFGRARQKFGAGFAIGGWFIPLANFIIPAMQLFDIWKGSGPPLRPGEKPKGSALIVLWWIPFILGRFLIQLTPAYSAGSIYKLSTFDVVNVLVIIGAVMTALAAVLAIFVIRGITERQDAGLVSLTSGAPGGVPAPPSPPPIPPA